MPFCRKTRMSSQFVCFLWTNSKTVKMLLFHCDYRWLIIFQIVHEHLDRKIINLITSIPATKRQTVIDWTDIWSALAHWHPMKSTPTEHPYIKLKSSTKRALFKNCTFWRGMNNNWPNTIQLVATSITIFLGFWAWTPFKSLVLVCSWWVCSIKALFLALNACTHLMIICSWSDNSEQK